MTGARRKLLEPAWLLHHRPWSDTSLIIDLRTKVDNITRDLTTRLDAKADKNATLDLLNQNEQMLAEVAKLRGQIEVLANELATVQKNQRELYADMDARIKKLEPPQGTTDGAEAAVAPTEQQEYEAALALFQTGDNKSQARIFMSSAATRPKPG